MCRQHGCGQITSTEEIKRPSTSNQLCNIHTIFKGLQDFAAQKKKIDNLEIKDITLII